MSSHPDGTTTSVEELNNSFCSVTNRFVCAHREIVLEQYGNCEFRYEFEDIQKLRGHRSLYVGLRHIFPHSCCLSKVLESEEAKLLCEFVSTDPSLLSVEVEWYGYDQSLCSPGILTAGWRYIMPAIAANQSIVRLKLPSPLWCGEDAFCDMLGQTQSLQILEMTLNSKNEADMRLRIADAFRVNVTLKYVALSAEMHGPHNGPFMTAIIDQLVHHPRLEYLRLGCTYCRKTNVIHHTAILCNLLKTTSTLKTIALSGYIFGTLAMENLVEGLLSNRTVTKLVLVNQGFTMMEESSNDIFMNFLSRTDVDCPLYMLEYSGCVDRLGEAMFPAASHNETPLKTIASKVQVLKLSTSGPPSRDISSGGFFDVLLNSANACRSQLQELDVGPDISSSCFAVVVRGLHELVHLQKFPLPLVVNPAGGTEFDWKRVIHAVHKSGSLHQIDNLHWLRHPKRNLLRVFEKRNKVLPVVLKKICEQPQVPVDEVSVDAPTLAHEREAHDISILPTLLYVAQPMYRWGTTYSLMGLLAMNGNAMDIGPCRCPKRLRQGDERLCANMHSSPEDTP